MLLSLFQMDVQTLNRIVIVHIIGYIELHAAQSLYDLHKTIKVHGQEIVDRQTGQLFDLPDQLLLGLLVLAVLYVLNSHAHGGVELLLISAQGDLGIPGQRENVDAVGIAVIGEQHNGIAPQALLVHANDQKVDHADLTALLVQSLQGDLAPQRHGGYFFRRQNAEHRGTDHQQTGQNHRNYFKSFTHAENRPFSFRSCLLQASFHCRRRFPLPGLSA